MANINWVSLGALSSGVSTFLPIVGVNADGRLEAFLIGMDGALWHIWQLTPNAGWGAWTSLGQPPTGSSAFSDPEVGVNADGRLEVFVTNANALWHIWQLTPNGGWGVWTSLGAPPNIAGIDPSVTVGKNADGRLDVFLIGTDNALWHIWQLTPNGGWGVWTSLGQPPNRAYNSNYSVGVNADGRLEVFFAGSGTLWHIWQLTPNDGWGAWTSLDAPSNVTGDVNYPAVGVNADGRLEVFVVGTDNALWHTWQLSPGGAWY